MDQNQSLIYFCENLRLLRQVHHLSKTKMANILGVGICTLNNIEQGIALTRLKCSVLYRAGEYFHLRTDDLLRPLKDFNP